MTIATQGRSLSLDELFDLRPGDRITVAGRTYEVATGEVAALPAGGYFEVPVRGVRGVRRLKIRETTPVMKR